MGSDGTGRYESVRYSHCYLGCDHRYCARYDKTGEGKCWELWHAGMRRGPYCQETIDHDGPHRGAGVVWPRACRANIRLAERFLAAYRRVPNAFHDITLRDDGVVEASVGGFEAAVRFLGVSRGDD